LNAKRLGAGLQAQKALRQENGRGKFGLGFPIVWALSSGRLVEGESEADSLDSAVPL